jgi:hypothetical protein
MTDFYEVFQKAGAKIEAQQNPNLGKSHVFATPFRMLLAGASGSGKSNTLLDVIQRMGKTFMKIVLCMPSADEYLYNQLKEHIGDKMEIFEGEAEYENGRMGPNIPELDCINEEDDKGYVPTLVVFDDWMIHKNQARIMDYFIRARKRNVSCVYISQAFYQIPKVVRLQANYIILKRGANMRDLRMIMSETSVEASPQDFQKMYKICTDSLGRFLLINMYTNMPYDTFKIDPITDVAAFVAAHAKGRGFVKVRKSSPKKNIMARRDLHNSLVNASCQEFCDHLITAVRGGAVDGRHIFDDVFSSYKDFCKDNNYDVKTKYRLGMHMSRCFEKAHTDNGKRIYLLDPDFVLREPDSW